MNCKYVKKEIVNGILHEKCTNEELKEINKSNCNDIPCRSENCSKFEKCDNDLH